MSEINQLLALANEAAEFGPDMNEAVSGGGGGRLLPVGNAFAVLVGVIELGQHPQEFAGKAKDAADEVQLVFALVGGAGINGEKYVNDDGTPYILRCYPFALSRNEKARAFLTFKKMNWKGQAKSFAQLLGQAFFLPIKQVAKSKTDSALVSRPELTGIIPPLDSMTGAPYPAPQVDPKLYQLFLWERPTLECWDSLYAEGTFDDGESKNVLQGTIAAALNFQGSPIQTLLLNAQRPIPNPRQRAKKAAATPATPATPVAPAAPASPNFSSLAQPAIPAAPGVATPAPLAQPAVAAVAPAVQPQTPTSTTNPSATPAGTPMTFPSSLPGMPPLPTAPQ